MAEIINEEACEEVLSRLAKSPPGATATLLVDGDPHLVHISRRPQDGEGGVFRFVGNAITRAMLDAATGDGPPWKGVFDLNAVARGSFSARDRRRFYIDIAYSVDGFLNLIAQDNLGTRPCELGLP